MKRFGWVARTALGTLVLMTTTASAAALAGAEPTPESPTSSASRTQASITVTGAIIDSDCYMKRGAGGMGAAHRDCAIK